METSNQIYKSMAKILKDVDAIGKNKVADMKNAGVYNFRGIDDMYNTLHKLFADNSVFIIPEVLETTLEAQEKEKEWNNKITKSLQYSVLVKIKFTFYAEDGSSVSAIGIGHAIDNSDKGTNKAQSSALKYCLMQTFLIPTIEDKDVENSDLSVNKKSQNKSNSEKKLPAPLPKNTESVENEIATKTIYKLENNLEIDTEKAYDWLFKNQSKISESNFSKITSLLVERENQNKIVNIEPNVDKITDEVLANFDPNYTN